MAKETEPKGEREKPGPKEVRLVITREPEKALADLLKLRPKPKKKR